LRSCCGHIHTEQEGRPLVQGPRRLRKEPDSRCCQVRAERPAGLAVDVRKTVKVSSKEMQYSKFTMGGCSWETLSLRARVVPWEVVGVSGLCRPGVREDQWQTRICRLVPGPVAEGRLPRRRPEPWGSQMDGERGISKVALSRHDQMCPTLLSGRTTQNQGQSLGLAMSQSVLTLARAARVEWLEAKGGGLGRQQGVKRGRADHPSKEVCWKRSR
jgi:hypothetical protein